MAEERISPESSDYIEVMFHWHRYLSVSELCKNKVVLDVACGEGYGTYYLSQFAAKIVGVDIDSDVIRNAKKKYERDNLTYVEGLAENLDFPTGYFDVVVSFETIEHLRKENQERFLSEVKRVLKPNGVFIVSTPDKARTDLFLAKNPFHLNELSCGEFIKLLKVYFSRVDVYLQEVNLASVIWPHKVLLNNQAPFLFKNYFIEYTENEARPTDKPLSLHLSVIALCVNESDGLKEDIFKYNLSSFCQETNRKPIEEIWAKLQELDNLLKRRDIELEELEAELKVRDIKLEKLDTELKKRDIELNKMVSKQKILKEQLDITHHQNLIMARELTNLYKQNNELRDEVIQLHKDKDELTEQLEIIKCSRSWKLVQKYWSMMDRPIWRLLLTPIRKFCIWVWRIGRR